MFPNGGQRTAWVLGVWCLLGAVAEAHGSATRPAAGGNLAFHGDFERVSKAAPPDGWTMWGASRYKDPANYTRDTTRPHGGKACFRIHHPAGTAGYIVSSPTRAIRPGKGKMYVVSFWARTDKPGPSFFRVQGYRSLSPYVGARMPGHSQFQPGRDWTRIPRSAAADTEFSL